MTNHYVYVLYDWQGIPRYVGAAGTKRRLASSKRPMGHNKAKDDFLRETNNRLGNIPSAVIRTGLTNEEAAAAEKELIEAIGRSPNGPLTNMTTGGEPHQFSEERKAKIGAAHRGRIISETQRALISQALTGRTLSPEHVAALSRGRIGIKPTRGEWIHERNAKLRGRKRSPEQLVRIRAAVAARPSRKGILLSDEVKARQSAGAAARWARDSTPRATKGPDGKFVKNG